MSAPQAPAQPARGIGVAWGSTSNMASDADGSSSGVADGSPASNTHTHTHATERPGLLAPLRAASTPASTGGIQINVGDAAPSSTTALLSSLASATATDTFTLTHTHDHAEPLSSPPILLASLTSSFGSNLLSPPTNVSPASSTLDGTALLSRGQASHDSAHTHAHTHTHARGVAQTSEPAAPDAPPSSVIGHVFPRGSTSAATGAPVSAPASDAVGAHTHTHTHSHVARGATEGTAGPSLSPTDLTSTLLSTHTSSAPAAAPADAMDELLGTSQSVIAGLAATRVAGTAGPEASGGSLGIAGRQGASTRFNPNARPLRLSGGSAGLAVSGSSGVLVIPSGPAPLAPDDTHASRTTSGAPPGTADTATQRPVLMVASRSDRIGGGAEPPSSSPGNTVMALQTPAPSMNGRADVPSGPEDAPKAPSSGGAAASDPHAKPGGKVKKFVSKPLALAHSNLAETSPQPKTTGTGVSKSGSEAGGGKSILKRSSVVPMTAEVAGVTGLDCTASDRDADHRRSSVSGASEGPGRGSSGPARSALPLPGMATTPAPLVATTRAKSKPVIPAPLLSPNDKAFRTPAMTPKIAHRYTFGASTEGASEFEPNDGESGSMIRGSMPGGSRLIHQLSGATHEYLNCCARIRCPSWDQVRSTAWRIVDSRMFSWVLLLLTLFALFSDDVRRGFTPKSFDDGFFATSTVVLAVYVFEFAVNIAVRPRYVFTFYFWMEVFITASMITDIGWIWQAVIASYVNATPRLAEGAVRLPWYEGGGTIVSAAAGDFETVVVRTVRLFRYVRVVKLYKALKKSFLFVYDWLETGCGCCGLVCVRPREKGPKPDSDAASAAIDALSEFNGNGTAMSQAAQNFSGLFALGGAIGFDAATTSVAEATDPLSRRRRPSFVPGEAATRQRRPSNGGSGGSKPVMRVGTKLSDLTTRRVIILILFLMFMSPILDSTLYLEDTDKALPKLELALLARRPQDLNTSAAVFRHELQSFAVNVGYVLTLRVCEPGPSIAAWSSGQESNSSLWQSGCTNQVNQSQVAAWIQELDGGSYVSQLPGEAGLWRTSTLPAPVAVLVSWASSDSRVKTWQSSAMLPARRDIVNALRTAEYRYYQASGCYSGTARRLSSHAARVQLLQEAHSRFAAPHASSMQALWKMAAQEFMVGTASGADLVIDSDEDADIALPSAVPRQLSDSPPTANGAGYPCLSYVVIDRRAAVRSEALYAIGKSLFMILIVGIGAVIFTRDAQALVVRHIERMVSMMRALRSNPLQPLDKLYANLRQQDAGPRTSVTSPGSGAQTARRGSAMGFPFTPAAGRNSIVSSMSFAPGAPPATTRGGEGAFVYPADTARPGDASAIAVGDADEEEEEPRGLQRVMSNMTRTASRVVMAVRDAMLGRPESYATLPAATPSTAAAAPSSAVQPLHPLNTHNIGTFYGHRSVHAYLPGTAPGRVQPGDAGTMELTSAPSALTLATSHNASFIGTAGTSPDFAAQAAEVMTPTAGRHRLRTTAHSFSAISRGRRTKPLSCSSMCWQVFYTLLVRPVRWMLVQLDRWIFVDDESDTYETMLLENTIIKVGGLLQVGFGEAGRDIIAKNMQGHGTLRPLVMGVRVDAVFGFCDVRNFTDVTECLSTEVMIFVNKIGRIVHGATHRLNGAPNKNIGDAFLLVWKLPPINTKTREQLLTRGSMRVLSGAVSQAAPKKVAAQADAIAPTGSGRRWSTGLGIFGGGKTDSGRALQAPQRPDMSLAPSARKNLLSQQMQALSQTHRDISTTTGKAAGAFSSAAGQDASTVQPASAIVTARGAPATLELLSPKAKARGSRPFGAIQEESDEAETGRTRRGSGGHHRAVSAPPRPASSAMLTDGSVKTLTTLASELSMDPGSMGNGRTLSSLSRNRNSRGSLPPAARPGSQPTSGGQTGGADDLPPHGTSVTSSSSGPDSHRTSDSGSGMLPGQPRRPSADVGGAAAQPYQEAADRPQFAESSSYRAKRDAQAHKISAPSFVLTRVIDATINEENENLSSSMDAGPAKSSDTSPNGAAAPLVRGKAPVSEPSVSVEVVVHAGTPVGKDMRASAPSGTADASQSEPPATPARLPTPDLTQPALNSSAQHRGDEAAPDASGITITEIPKRGRRSGPSKAPPEQLRNISRHLGADTNGPVDLRQYILSKNGRARPSDSSDASSVLAASVAVDAVSASERAEASPFVSSSPVVPVMSSSDLSFAVSRRRGDARDEAVLAAPSRRAGAAIASESSPIPRSSPPLPGAVDTGPAPSDALSHPPQRVPVSRKLSAPGRTGAAAAMQSGASASAVNLKAPASASIRSGPSPTRDGVRRSLPDAKELAALGAAGAASEDVPPRAGPPVVPGLTALGSGIGLSVVAPQTMRGRGTLGSPLRAQRRSTVVDGSNQRSLGTNGVVMGRKKSDVQRRADEALAAFLKIIVDIHRANTNPKDDATNLRVYQRHTKIAERFPNGSYSVKMGFGLHIGWAIEGAIGSKYKVDASYLSPHVNLAARLEAATKQFAVPLLISHDFAKQLSDAAQLQLRLIDCVTVKGSKEPMKLYTYDIFTYPDEIGEDPQLNWDRDADGVGKRARAGSVAANMLFTQDAAAADDELGDDQPPPDFKVKIDFATDPAVLTLQTIKRGDPGWVFPSRVQAVQEYRARKGLMVHQMSWRSAMSANNSSTHSMAVPVSSLASPLAAELTSRSLDDAHEAASAAVTPRGLPPSAAAAPLSASGGPSSAPRSRAAAGSPSMPSIGEATPASHVSSLTSTPGAVTAARATPPSIALSTVKEKSTKGLRIVRSDLQLFSTETGIAEAPLEMDDDDDDADLEQAELAALQVEYPDMEPADFEEAEHEMCDKLVHSFFSTFNDGVTAYIEGDWESARASLRTVLESIKRDDGPTKTLMRVLDELGDPSTGMAPRDWKRYRELTEK